MPLLEFDDNASEATFASFSTAVSAISRGALEFTRCPKL
jgi:hypothetical protein